MNDVFDFLIKRQMAFVFLAVLGGATLFFYFAMIEGLGYYRTSLLSGVIMAVGLAVVTTIRVLIYFLSRFSNGDSVKDQSRKFDGSVAARVDFTIFLLKFIGIHAIAFCFSLGIFSMYFFILKR
ncbi:hypothetical protein LJR038_003490 [Acidovorax sp. LjRoot38]|uniref:hypothetical protein n=1 Tax=Acidovorax sp. LjRoot38 TaxID=3342327 RepID=UPI003ECD29B2